VVLASCKSLPEFKKPISIYVNTFKVSSAQKELGSYLKLSLQEKLHQSKNYIVVHDQQKADCIIYGQVYLKDSIDVNSGNGAIVPLTAFVEFKVREAKAQKCEILKVMGYRSSMLSSPNSGIIQLKGLASALAEGITNKMINEHTRQYPDLIRVD
jgi:hypothetical protein